MTCKQIWIEIKCVEMINILHTLFHVREPVCSCRLLHPLYEVTWFPFISASISSISQVIKWDTCCIDDLWFDGFELICFEHVHSFWVLIQGYHLMKYCTDQSKKLSQNLLNLWSKHQSKNSDAEKKSMKCQSYLFLSVILIKCQLWSTLPK